MALFFSKVPEMLLFGIVHEKDTDPEFPFLLPLGARDL